jgi:hypothetical protein
MTDKITCQACRESDCDNCHTPNPFGRESEHGGVDPKDGREGWYPECCCGRITLGPTSPQGRAALVRAKRDAGDLAKIPDGALVKVVTKAAPRDPIVTHLIGRTHSQIRLAPTRVTDPHKWYGYDVAEIESIEELA